jgi:diguanylate cyclase (GGDEF)-like protein
MSTIKGYSTMPSEERHLPAQVPEAGANLDAQRGFWLTHMRIGFGIFLAETLVVMVDLALTPRGTHRQVLWILVGTWLVTALAGLGSAPTVASKPWRDAFSVAWTVASAFAVSVVAILDGGLNSPILVLLFLPLVYAALMFTPRATASCGGSALISVGLVALTNHQLENFEQRGLLFFAVLAGASVLSVAASVNRTRIEQHEHQLLDRVAVLASVDELTGCVTRRVFRQRLAEEISRSMRQDYRLSLMMVDVDEFKSVNDTYGHVVGDHVLAAVGAVLREDARSFDLVGRLGGDEFAVLLPDTEPSDAVTLAGRIRHRLRTAVEVPVTLSIGVSGLDRSAPTVEQMFDDADLALYQVKRSGRDAVAVRATSASAISDR